MGRVLEESPTRSYSSIKIVVVSFCCFEGANRVWSHVMTPNKNYIWHRICSVNTSFSITESSPVEQNNMPSHKHNHQQPSWYLISSVSITVCPQANDPTVACSISTLDDQQLWSISDMRWHQRFPALGTCPAMLTFFGTSWLSKHVMLQTWFTYSTLLGLNWCSRSFNLWSVMNYPTCFLPWPWAKPPFLTKAELQNNTWAGDNLLLNVSTVDSYKNCP